MKFKYALMMATYSLVYSDSVLARSLKTVSSRVKREASSFAVEGLLIAATIIGLLMAFGSAHASQKAKSWGIGAIFVFGAGTFMGMIKGWF